MSQCNINDRKKAPSAFLRNLFQILQQNEHSQTISWVPQSGNGFIIKDLIFFQSAILPKYFKHKKYSSFVRQLNMYGFHKQRNSNHQNCFLHQQFRKGNQLPTDIKRKPQRKKKTGVDGQNQSQSHSQHQNNQNQMMNNQQKISPQQNQNDWLSIGRQLRHHFPHLVQNILIQEPTIIKPIPSHTIKRPITLNRQLNDYKQVEFNKIQVQREMDEESEEYVSKISLRGFFFNNQQEDNEGGPKSKQSKQDGPDNNQMEQSQRVSYSQQYQNHSSQNQFQDSQLPSSNNHASESPDKYPTKNSNSIQNLSNLLNCIPSQSQITLQSISTLSQILIRQNNSLRKTLPLIRDGVIRSQGNKITYLEQMIMDENNGRSLSNGSCKHIKDNISKDIKENARSRERSYIMQITQQLQQQNTHFKHIYHLLQANHDTQLPKSSTSIHLNIERSIQ